MTRYLSISLWLFVASALFGADAPKIEFSSPVLDFGRVKAGEVVKRDFIFTNTGKATLEILDVKPGCGCTTAGSWDKKVEPGKTGTIPLQFNSAGFGGSVAKSATITCNDPIRSNLVVTISGTVWRPIDTTPQTVMFTPVAEAATNETKVIRLVSNLDEPITLSDLRSSSPVFKPELKEIKPGKEFEIHVTAVPPFTNPSVYASITLKTSSTNMPMVNMSAYAMVQQPVTVSPQQLMLPAGPLKAPFNTAVTVRNTSTNAFEVSNVKLDLPGVDLKVAQPQTGRLYSITLSFPVGFELQPTQKVVALTMNSTHPKFSEIKVPIIQMRAAPAAVATPAGGAPQTASPVRIGMPIPASPTTK